VAEIRKVEPVKLICAVCFSPEIKLRDIEQNLEKIFGKIENRSEVFDFSFTDYYAEEMGKNLKKVFFSFTNTIMPGELANLKIKSNEIEKEFLIEGKRKVNIDPGYLSGSKLVVASAKNFAHRIYIGKGIYGDLQLQYRHERFWPHEWTFPDYKSEIVISFLEKVRKDYLLKDRYDKKNKL